MLLFALFGSTFLCVQPNRLSMTTLLALIKTRMIAATGFAGVITMSAIVLANSHMPMSWMDDANGYAIAGYDPVDYFVKGRAVRPNTRIEAVWGGVSWNFRNVGNKAAFLADPRVYAPRFGGVDPYQLANNQSVLGNPAVFDIYEKRLYLFYDGVSLLAWKQDRKAYIARAILAWPKAAASLGLGLAKEKKAPVKVKRENKDGFLFPRPKLGSKAK